MKPSKCNLKNSFEVNTEFQHKVNYNYPYNFYLFVACEICCIALLSVRLDCIRVTSKWSRQEVVTCL